MPTNNELIIAGVVLLGAGMLIASLIWWLYIKAYAEGYAAGYAQAKKEQQPQPVILAQPAYTRRVPLGYPWRWE